MSNRHSARHATHAQLRLVTDPPPAPGADADTDPTRAVFEHWVFMLGRMQARCKLGPTRRAAINGALTLYSPDELMLAMEGLAAEAFEGASPQAVERMHELEWALASESRIERFVRAGEALRARADAAERRMRERAAAPADEQAVPDEAQAERAAAQRERLRRMAAALREGGR